jgi:hypothetical protein
MEIKKIWFDNKTIFVETNENKIGQMPLEWFTPSIRFARVHGCKKQANLNLKVMNYGQTTLGFIGKNLMKICQWKVFLLSKKGWKLFNFFKKSLFS